MKLFLDKTERPPAGWHHLTEGQEFKTLLNAVKYDDIEVVTFGDLECEDLLDFNECDCLTQLIEKANGKPLPCVFIKANTKSTKTIKEITEHYNNSYKYTTDLIIID